MVQGMRKQVEVPRSIPGLVTQRMLTMTFLEGTQITRLRNKVCLLRMQCLGVRMWGRLALHAQCDGASSLWCKRVQGRLASDQAPSMLTMTFLEGTQITRLRNDPPASGCVAGRAD